MNFVFSIFQTELNERVIFALLLFRLLRKSYCFSCACLYGASPLTVYRRCCRCWGSEPIFLDNTKFFFNFKPLKETAQTHEQRFLQHSHRCNIILVRYS